MNKEKQQVYNEVLAGVLDRFGLTEERMFKCNCAECVEASPVDYLNSMASLLGVNGNTLPATEK